jgi:hypothetical protein
MLPPQPASYSLLPARVSAASLEDITIAGSTQSFLTVAAIFMLASPGRAGPGRGRAGPARVPGYPAPCPHNPELGIIGMRPAAGQDPVEDLRPPPLRDRYHTGTPSAATHPPPSNTARPRSPRYVTPAREPLDADRQKSPDRTQRRSRSASSHNAVRMG